ncbi:MAG: DEAD/DEAH box helicase family protein, partial [Sandaracinaceae bacterium]|nr:DEAD/DEAH box helicase family protein [Sandaracinaceae bacterium]
MSYFVDTHDQFHMPFAREALKGFRPPQIAAAHAIAAHFYSRREPAIVTMPTGSGKTAVLLAVSFLLRPARVLVLTPSRLVREQLREQFGSMSLLKDLRALPPECAPPKVSVVNKRIGSLADWEELRDADVVVATAFAVSPEIEAIPDPPADLFDLILVDEAHHVAARTWAGLLRHFVNARQVLVTATPYRADGKEIDGRFVFSYPLRRALEDGVFGEIHYEAVELKPGESEDAKLAKAAAARFAADGKAGLDHRLMIRTDSVSRAEELVKVYEEHTSLRVQLVKGSHSLKHVRGVIDLLRSGKLDAIVCVDMLGEGFDLPQLKLAAIHSPHRSLAITLQFIGRFARTTAENTGNATFMAVPSDEIKIEAERLYEAGTAWNEVVVRLAGDRIDAELATKDVLESFEEDAEQRPGNLASHSLYSLQPYFHVKVLGVPNGVDLTRPLNLPSEFDVLLRRHSPKQDALIYVAREASRAPWEMTAEVLDLNHELFVVHHRPKEQLLFICASRRHQGLYDKIADSVVVGSSYLLGPVQLNRALNGLTGAEFFNVGLRNRSAYGTTESYRTMAGPAADRAIQRSDGRFYDRGHCFGKGIEADGSSITIGLSSASKIWSNRSDRVPALLAWCGKLAEKLADKKAKKTGSGLDHLGFGKVITKMPTGIAVMLWAAEVYVDPPNVVWADGDTPRECSLLDLAVSLSSSSTGLDVKVLHQGEVLTSVSYRLDKRPHFAARSGAPVTVQVGRRALDLAEYLNDEIPSFFTPELSRLEGNVLYESTEAFDPFDTSVIREVDWSAANVDVAQEKETSAPGLVPIFEFISSDLLAGAEQVILFDDGTGEIADFVTMSENSDGVLTTFYHCKAAGGVCPGNRVEDVYEVCAQAVKSTIWTRPATMRQKLKQRVARGSKFLRGTLADAETMFAETRSVPRRY